MSKSIKNMSGYTRDNAIQRRITHGTKSKANPMPIKGLGYWASIDALYASKRTGDGHKNGSSHYKSGKNLERRRHDYHAMIAQTRIGDGHRDVTGYHCPGSNKK